MHGTIHPGLLTGRSRLRVALADEGPEAQGAAALADLVVLESDAVVLRNGKMVQQSATSQFSPDLYLTSLKHV